MLNAIPVIGWLISFLLATSLAIPFWFIWTVMEIGRKYFDFLPDKYLNIPFWHCVGLFIVVSIVKSVALPTISSSSSSGKD